jgi:hypothetical protein
MTKAATMAATITASTAGMTSSFVMIEFDENGGFIRWAAAAGRQTAAVVAAAFDLLGRRVASSAARQMPDTRSPGASISLLTLATGLFGG